VNPSAKLALRALLGACACALLLPVAAPAASRSVAATPCWQALLNDWYDGQINHVYPIPCYRDAINHLPTDVSVYSSARDDINRALQLAIARQKNPSAPAPTITDSSSPAGASGATGSSGSAGRTQPPGPIPSAINNSSPGGATSFPLPLIILGGLAGFLLVLGGVGLAVRRMQGRGRNA
jgi:hypothetical protein